MKLYSIYVSGIVNRIDTYKLVIAPKDSMGYLDYFEEFNAFLLYNDALVFLQSLKNDPAVRHDFERVFNLYNHKQEENTSEYEISSLFVCVSSVMSAFLGLKSISYLYKHWFN